MTRRAKPRRIPNREMERLVCIKAVAAHRALKEADDGSEAHKAAIATAALFIKQAWAHYTRKEDNG